MKITVLDSYPLLKEELSYDFLKKYGELEVFNNTLKDDVIDRLKDTTICITNKIIIDKFVMDNTNLKYIIVSATGVNNIDLEYAKIKGIKVSNCKNYSTDFVAQHTIAFILQELNKINIHDETINKWVGNEYFSYTVDNLSELKGKTVGLVGYGNIAKKVKKILDVFEANVIVCNRTVYDDGTNFVTLEELLKNSDIISLHCPLTDNNKYMINKDALNLIKDGAILVNNARGGLVNKEDLVDALDSNKLKHYYTDVLEIEPPVDTLLIEHKKVTITPHIAWASIEARKRILEIIDKSVQNYIDNDFSFMII